VAGVANRFVSAGILPEETAVAGAVADVHRMFAAVDDGRVSEVYPALAQVDPDRFGIALAGVDGARHEVGDAREPFALMSVAKPFTFALVGEAMGVDRVRDLVGVDATGLPFNSVAAIERRADGRTNPMVNAGAIATVSLVPGGGLEERWRLLVDGLSRFAGRPLELDEGMLDSARATNLRNRSLALLLAGAGALEGDPLEVVELYTRQSCLRVTAVDLANMGATLADGGVNPTTGERVVAAEVARAALVVMTVAGLYETSGSWLMDVGLPGKSGIGGGIVTVSPGKGALGTFSPRLDPEGNSVRGKLVAQELSRRLGLDVLASRPVPGGAR